jgi:pimeloyl-ACP methyl ester carboxylesterase
MRQEDQNQIFRLRDGRSLGYAEYGSRQGAPVLHFHSAGSSRLEHPGQDEDAAASAVRLIVADRPGHGLPSFQKGRRLLDWAADVSQLADHLGIDEFAVTGWSAGGPHALACAHALPSRVKAAAVLAGAGPRDYRGAFRGLPFGPKALALSARYAPWFTYQIRRHQVKVITGEPSAALRLFEFLPAVDRAYLDSAGAGDMILSAIREGYRQGARGPARDDVVHEQDWGFDPREIRVRTDIWQGGQDVNVPKHAGEHQRTLLPGARFFFLPDEGHFSILAHWNAMLTGLLE